MASTASSSIETDAQSDAQSDERLWKALTKLSRIFHNKELNLYPSTINEALPKDKIVIQGLYSFAGLSVRRYEVAAASMGGLTADILKLVVCKTNDDRQADEVAPPENLPTATYSVARNTRGDAPSLAVGG